ncbi:MAG TPA: hypothetical protein VKM55_22745 [Candidatus Lokiarchaeia archaeon]|nr:hypothetical protein [Candidatus Lokiarchaeia archaeon]
MSSEEKKFLDHVVEEGIYNSISDALKAGVYQLVKEYRLKDVPWTNREEVELKFTASYKPNGKTHDSPEDTNGHATYQIRLRS